MAMDGTAVLLGRRDQIVDVLDPEAQVRHAELRHRATFTIAGRRRLEPVQQLEAQVTAAQHPRLEPHPVIGLLHRGGELVAEFHREDRLEAEDLDVEGGRPFEVGAADADVREPLDAHSDAEH